MAAPAAPTPAQVTFAAIEQARDRIAAHIVRTPCPKSRIGAIAGTQLHLKMENLQRTGSFKERGALNRMLLLDEHERRRGVVAASAGNHAQGVAYHAQRLGIPATICMPVNTPIIKVQRTRNFGAEVVLHGEGYDDAFERALEIGKERGRVFIHAFDDPAIIAGQGTLALEILADNPWLDVYVVPVGGGGLIAGMALAAKETNPKIKVIGVEVEAMAGARDSRTAGHVVTVPRRRTIADGIAVARVGELPFGLIQRYVDDIVTVTDEEIASAILVLLEEEKTVAEAAGAAAVAALLHDRVPAARGERSCAVITGGNIDVNVISRIIDRGLVKDGRLMSVSLVLPDLPGTLAALTALIARLRANVLEIIHHRRFSTGPVGEIVVALTLETRGRDHVNDIKTQLQAAGYRLYQGPELSGE